MVITRKNYQGIIDALKDDLGLELRFTARVIFVNNLSGYYRLVSDLKDMSDEVICLSYDSYCAGNDSVPDLKKVLEHISAEKDKNILIMSIGEYLRFAMKYESSVKCIHSIMTYPMHSTKRIWIPVYAAKDIFQDVVGELPSERYELYELEEEADEFECFVYSDAFSEKSGLVPIRGLKQMYRAWDELKASSGMSFSTKKLSLIPSSSGNYAVHVIKSPFEFIQQHLKSPNPKFEEKLGTDSFWAKLATVAASENGSLDSIIEKALNVASFDAQQIVSSWSHLSSNDGYGKWLLWLWYKLNLTASGDYLGYAIQRANTYNDIQNEIECAIFDCVSSSTFDTWVRERMIALKNMGVAGLSSDFWKAFDTITDERTKLKLLSNNTHEERTRILEIVSGALRSNKKLSDYKSLLSEKYPDLLLYFMESNYLSGSLEEYMQTYKQFKIMDYYDLSISESALDVDTFEFDTRSKILNSIKCEKNAYYLWIDGMGVEWVDMLIKKVGARNSALAKPTVEIGMAAVPTTTAVNMAKADPDTVSYKFNEFDSLSHIKDKSDCNYFSIVDKQFGLMDIIADMIVEVASENSGKAIVVTADHGMSRMAAKAFHEKQGLTPPVGSEIQNLGRYCILPNGVSPYSFSHTYKEDNCLAFMDHSHFTCPGFAPGEIHGGASPEEWLVPIITFKNNQKQKSKYDVEATYKLLGSILQPNMAGIVEVKVKTSGEVNSMLLELGTTTYVGVNTAKNQWSISIPNLLPGKEYTIRIHLNNVFSKKTETISIKRRGLDVDDDF